MSCLSCGHLGYPNPTIALALGIFAILIVRVTDAIHFPHVLHLNCYHCLFIIITLLLMPMPMPILIFMVMVRVRVKVKVIITLFMEILMSVDLLVFVLVLVFIDEHCLFYLS